MLAQGPLGGAESSCIHFVTALARHGYDVTIYTSANDTYREGNLQWKPLSAFEPAHADMVIAHRSPHLFSAHPVHACQKILYLHNPAGYLTKWKHRRHLYKHKPAVIFSGAYHASTWPLLLPKTQHMIIPYAIDPIFTQELPRSTAPLTAVFTSNPLRSLDWLLDTWERYIHPACPTETLQLYTGPEVYPNLKPQKVAAMQAVMDQARALQNKGVVLNKPLPKEQLMSMIKNARMMLYRGDRGESFCLALGEAQALGVPVVTEGIGSCKERVIHAETGFIATGQQAFADCAISLFTDDLLWQTQHLNALNRPAYTWDDAVVSLRDLLKIGNRP